MANVRRRLPHVEVRTSYAEHAEPRFSETMAAQQKPSIVVPLLLSSGRHATVDVPTMAQASRVPTRVGRALGPHPLLAAAMIERIQAAGARRGDALVMVSAGTRDADGLVDLITMGRLLQGHWGAPVRVAHLSGNGPHLKECVDGLWAQGHRRIIAAPYLLAPGQLLRKAKAQAMVAGCTAIGAELGAHRLVGELVIRRYLAAAASKPAPIVTRSRVA